MFLQFMDAGHLAVLPQGGHFLLLASKRSLLLGLHQLPLFYDTLSAVVVPVLVDRWQLDDVLVESGYLLEVYRRDLRLRDLAGSLQGRQQLIIGFRFHLLPPVFPALRGLVEFVVAVVGIVAVVEAGGACRYG